MSKRKNVLSVYAGKRRITSWLVIRVQQVCDYLNTLTARCILRSGQLQYHRDEEDEEGDIRGQPASIHGVFFDVLRRGDDGVTTTSTSWCHDKERRNGCVGRDACRCSRWFYRHTRLASCIAGTPCGLIVPVDPWKQTCWLIVGLQMSSGGLRCDVFKGFAVYSIGFDQLSIRSLTAVRRPVRPELRDGDTSVITDIATNIFKSKLKTHYFRQPFRTSNW